MPTLIYVIRIKFHQCEYAGHFYPNTTSNSLINLEPQAIEKYK